MPIPPTLRAYGPWPLALLLVWPLAVVPGFVVVERYAATPGRPADPPAVWPARVDVQRTSGLATIVMLAHPRCPCTHASIEELARLMAQVAGRAEAFVLFFDPTGERWEHSELWQNAQAIPGVRAIADPGGFAADAFGAHTSGQVVVYDATGRLVFDGGVTRARGHEGDNIGRTSIQALLTGSTANATSAVFGCDLREPERAR